MTTACSVNLNYARPPAAHIDDLAYIATRAQVILGQELAPKARLAHWDVVGADHDERVLVSPLLRVERSGERLAALSRFGERIGLRVFAWADVDCPDVGSIRFVSVHMPPRRMTGTLTRVYGYRLRRLLRRANRRSVPWVVGGDFNQRFDTDPASLERLLGATWHGPRIDGFAVSPSLDARVSVTVDYSRIRPDDHPFVFLDITPKRKDR